MNKVCIVIVTYNRYDMLNRCLHSLRVQTCPATSIIIIDNASTDGTKERVEREWCGSDSRIHYHRLDRNMGGAGGFKRGMELAFLEDCTWILVMDDDAAPEEDFIKKLLDSYARNPEVRCFTGSEYVGYTGIREYGGRRRIVNENTLEEDVVGEEEYRNNIEFYIDSFTFVGVMFQKEIGMKTGLPDDSLFIYYDDTDYSFRIREYTKILCVSDAVIHHRTDDIDMTRDELNKDWRQFYLIRNSLLIKRRYMKCRRDYYVYLLEFIAKRVVNMMKGLVRRRCTVKMAVKELYVVGRAVRDVKRMKGYG